MSNRYRLDTPVEIDAVKVRLNNVDELQEFGGANFTILTNFGNVERVHFLNPLGPMSAEEGMYIIKGPDGEYYPSKAELFEQFYKRVDTAVGT